ncbi:UNVERIFIED_CONTAM: hypothetical protein O8I53_06500 [Campylobacter lari]
MLKYAPNLRFGIKSIINKIKVNNSFDNFKEGIISIINNIDFNVISNYLNTSLKTHYITYSTNEYDYEKDKIVKNYYDVALETILPNEGIFALLNGMFANPGTNRSFKNNLIKTFNLSSEVTEIKVGDAKLIVPKNDPDKLGFVDFASVFAGTLNDPDSSIFVNYKISQDLEKLSQIIND